MKKDTNIQPDTTGRRSRMSVWQSLQNDERTEDVVCFPVKVEPLPLSALCFTEEQAAAMLNIHAEELRRERERGAINYRRLGRYIRYTMVDLHEYLEKSRVCVKSSGKDDH